jgi:aminopeptidase N
MEFPMMQNNGAPISVGSNLALIYHEISHNYFPFYMGTNERRTSWMDEGWASFFVRNVVEKYDSTYYYQAYRVAEYLGVAGTYKDMPMILPSYMMTTGEMRNNFYNRPAIAYEELRHLLGDEIFHKALLEYMNRWHEKHPISYDFFFTFDDVVGEDLSWFWNPWFFELGYPDLGIENVEINGNDITITVKKIGNIPTRIAYTLIFDDGTREQFIESAYYWKNSNTSQFKFTSPQKLKIVELGDNLIPDANQKNNLFEIQ